jgi:hypothetical protein
MVEPIPKETLRAERLRFERHVAAVLMQALSESGLESHEVDDRLEQKHGAFKRFVGRLMDGNTGVAGPIVDIATAFDCRVYLQLTRPLAPQIETEPDKP